MNRKLSALVSGAALVVSALTATLPAQAAPSGPIPADPAAAQALRIDDKSNPLGAKQRALRDTAVRKLVNGEVTPRTTAGGSKVIPVAKGQYVRYGVERNESIFTILAEFGDQTLKVQGGTAGPLHNQIVEPDRTVDNITIWEPDFDQAYYQDLMFGSDRSFKDFYLKQSNGRFEAVGDVSDWVTLPYNEARYGHNPAPNDRTDEAEQYWAFITDTAAAWYDAQMTAGKTNDEVKADLAQFDQVDRYDYDMDGNFAEPDGYIDHFQALHAGEGEEGGGGAQGEDAIWSHSWYAYYTGYGKSGPAFNPAGGVPIGGSGLWIGDYTTEPENGGVGVFVHEFAHDLGLPDLYDTAGGDNSTAFWTLMSGGSWMKMPGDEGLGTSSTYMGPWEKLMLDWLDYQVVPYGKATPVKLGPADLSTKMPQAAIVLLPDKDVTRTLVTPHSGAFQWWTSSGDDLNNTLTRNIDLTGKKSAEISAWLNYDIELDYDYLYAEVSTDGGSTFVKLDDGLGGSSKQAWVQRVWKLSAYAGKNVQFRFRYQTDGGLAPTGGFIDDIVVTADRKTLFSDDVESGDNGWTAAGFQRVGANVIIKETHFYMAENRSYSGYDKGLQVGPYNLPNAFSKPMWAEFFPYQNGLLVWYVDYEYGDNNTIDHPGHGLALPVDARPDPIMYPSGARLGNRRQPFDATFGLEATDPVTFNREYLAGSALKTESVTVPSQRAIPVFNDADRTRYWRAQNPWASVQVAGSGTTIEVVSTAMQGAQMNLNVHFS